MGNYGQPPLVACAACGNAVSLAAVQCPHCGHPVPRPQAPAQQPPSGYGQPQPPSGYGAPPGAPPSYGHPQGYPPGYGPQGYGPPHSPPRKGGMGPIIALIVIGIVVVCLGGVGYAVYSSYTPVCGNYGEPPCPGGDTPAQVPEPPAPVATPAPALALGDRCDPQSSRCPAGTTCAQIGAPPAYLCVNHVPDCPGNETLYADGQCHIFCRTNMPCPTGMECSGSGAFADGSGKAPYCVPATPAVKHQDECDPGAVFARSGGCGFDGTGNPMKCCHAAAPRTACVGAGGSFPLNGGLCEVPWLSCNAPEACAE